MVGQSHRLGSLQMGVAGKHGVQVLASAGDEDALQREESTLDRVAHVSKVEGQVGGHLVVATAPGVEPPCHASHSLLEPRLDVHVNVFQRRIEAEFSRLDLRRQRLQALDQGLDICLRQQPDAPEHPRVGDGAPDVVAGQRLVE